MFDVFTQDHIEREFWEFHNTHPEVYYQIIDLARRWKSNGHSKLGIATLFEVLRWNSHINRERDGGFKLNNNYRALYARLIMEREPDLADIFATRERTARL